MRGWVYVLSNKSMPGLVKIGFSTKDPELRAVELRSTGNPSAYDVEYDVLVDEPRTIEQNIHRQLAVAREGREWFRLTAAAAIIEIKKTIGTRPHLESYKRTSEAEVMQTHGQRLHAARTLAANHALRTQIGDKHGRQRLVIVQQLEDLQHKREKLISNTIGFPTKEQEDYLVFFLGLLLFAIPFLVVWSTSNIWFGDISYLSIGSKAYDSMSQRLNVIAWSVIAVTTIPPMFFASRAVRKYFKSRRDAFKQARDLALAELEQRKRELTTQLNVSFANEQTALQACAHKFT